MLRLRLPPRGRSLRLALVLAVAICATPGAQRNPLIATHQDAYIEQSGSTTWFIGNANVRLQVGFAASGTLTVERLWDPSNGDDWHIAQAADTTVTLGGTVLPFKLSDPTVAFKGATAEETDSGVRLTFTFEHRTLHTVIKRYYVCYPVSPTFETWTSIEAPVGSPTVQVSDLKGWSFVMPAAPLRWVNGLQYGSAEISPDAFSVSRRDLADGDQVQIGSDRRSSEQFVPLIFVDNGTRTFFGGVMWSGAWQIMMSRAGDTLTIATTIPDTATSVASGQLVEIPHTFFGITDRTDMSDEAALRQFVMRGIRKGRPLNPLVTYNTWFAYGSYITETNVDDEMRRAAALGVELFVLDAGWYEGAGEGGKGDFTSGLGSWLPDENRFPGQLLGFADEAHDLGMKFGLWVEPERIALSLVGQPDMPDETWLATHDGDYGTGGDVPSGQLCLASPAARDWVFNHLTQLIDAVRPDYLKWDNNSWTNCNRDGHGHGPDDGNFAHVSALYGLLDEIRQRYPNLLIENVSGGGNRLDYGMLAYTDTAWMDDVTTPSDVVRHNIEGLSSVFPPAYLLSFVADSGGEPFAGTDLAQIVRSRMPGILGLTYRVEEIGGDLSTKLAEAIAQYKPLRDTIAQSSASLLGGQAPVDSVDIDGWDVVQETSGDQLHSIVFAFKSDPSDGTIVVQPKGLLAGMVYCVRSVDNGDLGCAPGGDLMRDGVELVHTGDESTAHLIVFDLQLDDPPSDTTPPDTQNHERRPRR